MNWTERVNAHAEAQGATAQWPTHQEPRVRPRTRRMNWQLKATLPAAFTLFNGLLLFLLATVGFTVAERHTIIAVATAGAVAICAALLIGVAIVIGRPMVELQEKIARVRTGDMDARVSFAERDDEIGDLGRSFNDMVAELRESREEIQRLHKTQMSRAEHLATLGEIAAGLAHEIRNPLAGIAGVIEIVGRDLPANSAARDVIKEVRVEVQHINRIMTNLLEIARPKPARFGLADLNATAEHALIFAEQQTSGKAIQFAFQKAENLPLVDHDASQIHQVLLNLLLNAIQAIEGGGRVELQIQRRDGFAAVAVADTGRGIPPEHLPNIFRPFFTTKGHGTGLGLSLAHRIIEDHGGRVEVTSTVGEGTRFCVLLPLRRSASSS